jgi:hypothetical protein
MSDANYKLTTVKVLSDNYADFKLDTLNTDMTLQKLVNRAMREYLDNKLFKKQIDEVKLITNNHKY